MRLKRKKRCFDCGKPKGKLLAVYLLADGSRGCVCKACYITHYQPWGVTVG